MSSDSSSFGYSSKGMGGDETDTADISGHTCAQSCRSYLMRAPTDKNDTYFFEGGVGTSFHEWFLHY